jgi:hypothetical protein
MAEVAKKIDESREMEVDVVTRINPTNGKVGFQKFYRIGVFSLDEVLPFITKNSGQKYQEYKGFEVKMGSQRYALFDIKGTTCVRCGLKGDRFCLERTSGQNNRYHFNLYGTDEEGRDIMITKDHIIPRSKGGEDSLDNYQPMCILCNGHKANNMEEDEQFH